MQKHFSWDCLISTFEKAADAMLSSFSSITVGVSDGLAEDQYVCKSGSIMVVKPMKGP